LAVLSFATKNVAFLNQRADDRQMTERSELARLKNVIDYDD
jgi:hypothetical protein